MAPLQTLTLAVSAVLMAASGASAQAIIMPRASANGTGGTEYVTEVVTAYTTYCPSPTVVTQGSSKITVTKATTLTITNCPCTITRPATPTSNTPPKATPPMSIFHGAAAQVAGNNAAGTLAAAVAGALAFVAAAL